MDNFVDQLLNILNDRIGDEYDIQSTEVTKANDCKYTGLVFRKQDDILGATIYLDPYYERYRDESYDVIVDMICEKLAESEADTSNMEIVRSIKEFEQVKDRVFLKLVNKDLSEDYLQDKVFIEYLDLAILFSLWVDMNSTNIASITVTNALLKLWDIPKEKLYLIAKKNMKKEKCHKITPLDTYFFNLIGTSRDESLTMEENEIFILSNQNNLYGASALLSDSVMREFALEQKVDEVIILPSSIHETLLIPRRDDSIGIHSCYEMVKEVNATELESCDVLSNNVYLYDLKTDSISIAG